MTENFKCSKVGTRYSVLVIFLFVALATYGALSIKRLQTKYSVMQFLPTHHPSLQMDESVRAGFHLTDLPTFIGVISLNAQEPGTWLEQERIDKLAKLTEQISTLPNVGFSISVASVDGASDSDGVLNVGSVVKMTPFSLWPQRILNDALLTPNLISADARVVLIYTQLQNANVDVLVNFEARLKDMMSKTFPQSNSKVGGVPAVQTDLGLLLNKELRNFILLTALACALALFLIFSTKTTMIIPLTLTVFANLMVLALMAWTGLIFTILSTTIPVLVFITVLSLSTHILLRVYEDAKRAAPDISKWKLIYQSNRSIWLPNLLGALTTCVGFLTLLLSDVPLIRNYGRGVAEAVMLSWILTSVGIIPLLYLLPLPQPRAWVSRPARWTLWTIALKKPIVISVLGACLALAFFGRHLDWTGKLFDDLPVGQEARQSTEKIDRSMGGVIPVDVVIHAREEHAWNDPTRIFKLNHLLSDLRKTKGVGSAHSLPDFLHAMKPQGFPGFTENPASISEIYFLYSMSTANPIENFLASDGRSARIELRIHDLPSDQTQKLIDGVQKRVQAEFPGSRIEIGGMGAIVHLIHDQLSTSLIFGFWQALLGIVILLALIFRSLRWALVAALPNLIPPLALLAYLALTHTPIKPGVAIIFSIALGLAFNNTVYLLNRIRALGHGIRPFPVSRSFYLEGNPCLVSTLIIMMGFSVFLFSYFSLNQTFGACMLVSMSAGLLGDLIFLPALLRLWPALL